MTKPRGSHGGAESLVNKVLSEGRERMTIRADFAEEIARTAATVPRGRHKSRLGLPVVVIVVASVLTASTAVAGIVHFVRQARIRPPAQGIAACLECEPLPSLTASDSNPPRGGRGGRGRRGGAAPAVRDSTATPVQQAPLRTLTPEMRIVSSDSIPQTQLSRVLDVIVASDGFIFTNDNSAPTNCIRVYDPTGRFVRSFGRLGDGPGELSSAVNMVGLAGDTLVIYDYNRGDVLSFRRNGTYLRTYNMSGVFKGDRQLRGYLSGGRALVEIAYWRWPEKDSSAFRLTDSSKHEIVRIAVQPGMRDGYRVGSGVLLGRLSINGAQPYLPVVQTAQDPLGNRALVAIPSSYFGGQPGQVKLVLITKDGIQSERVVNLGARRVTNAIRDEWIKKLLDTRAAQFSAATMTRAAVERELRSQITMPQYMPEIQKAMVGSDGAIWLKPLHLDEWVLVSPAGAIVARVPVPANVTIHQVSMDRMWGVMPDEDGVGSIIRYRLGR